MSIGTVPKAKSSRTNLLATKPLNLLMEEARETGEHSLKRTLGVFQLTALGVGAIIGAGIFVMVGLGAQYAGPGLTLSFVLVNQVAKRSTWQPPVDSRPRCVSS